MDALGLLFGVVEAVDIVVFGELCNVVEVVNQLLALANLLRGPVGLLLRSLTVQKASCRNIHFIIILKYDR